MNECIIAFILALVLFFLFFSFTSGVIYTVGSPFSFLPLIVIVRNLIRLKKPLIIIDKKEIFYIAFTRVSKIQSFKIVTMYKKEFFEFQTSKSTINTELNSFNAIDIKRLKTTKLFQKN
jgi:hypothetical protein